MDNRRHMRFRPGDRVVHVRHGEGFVRTVSRDPSNRYPYTVQFNGSVDDVSCTAFCCGDDELKPLDGTVDTPGSTVGDGWTVRHRNLCLARQYRQPKLHNDYSVYRGVVVWWNGTDDRRPLELIDLLSEEQRQQLVSVELPGEELSLQWSWGPPPQYMRHHDRVGLGGSYVRIGRSTWPGAGVREQLLSTPDPCTVDAGDVVAAQADPPPAPPESLRASKVPLMPSIETAQELHVGDRVYHATWGPGVVRVVRLGPSRQRLHDILFDGYGWRYTVFRHELMGSTPPTRERADKYLSPLVVGARVSFNGSNVVGYVCGFEDDGYLVRWDSLSASGPHHAVGPFGRRDLVELTREDRDGTH